MSEFPLVDMKEWADEVKKWLVKVRLERINQYGKWGPQRHSFLGWLAILGEEFGETSKQVVEIELGHPTPEENKELITGLKDELVQVAAVAIAMAQAIENEVA